MLYIHKLGKLVVMLVVLLVVLVLVLDQLALLLYGMDKDVIARSSLPVPLSMMLSLLLGMLL